jgi:hypothetical protein
MNNYKELSFLISSLFVIYFFKDIITTLIILVILSSISALLIKADFEKVNNDYDKSENPGNKKSEVAPIYGNAERKEQYNTSQNPNNFVKSSNFVYNR